MLEYLFWKVDPLFDLVVLVDGSEHAVLLREKCNNLMRKCLKQYSIIIRLTLANEAAISKVPTVSMLDAIIGIPRKVCFELRKRISRYKSTYGIPFQTYHLLSVNWFKYLYLIVVLICNHPNLNQNESAGLKYTAVA